MAINPNLTNREVCDIVFTDLKTGVPFLNVDFANVTTTELTGEVVFAYGGKGHPKRVGFTGERGGTIKFETQIQPFKLYSLMTGASIDTTASFIKRETATTTAGTPTITLTKTPVGAKVNLFKADDDCGTVVPTTVSGTTVTLTTPTPGNYVVYYMEAIATNVKKLSIKATTFPKAFCAYMKTFDKTELDEVVPFEMVAYKCLPQSNISINCSNTGDPTTLTVTCDLMADSSGNMLDMILIEEAQ